MVNSERLRERVKATGIKKVFIADKLGISLQGYLNKESGKSDFTSSEIAVIRKLLNINNKDVAEIFLS